MNLSNLKKLVRLMGNTFPRWLIATCSVTLCDLIMKLSIAHLVRRLLDAAATLDIALLTHTVLQFAGLLVFAATLSPLAKYWAEITAYAATGEIRRNCFLHIQNLPMSYYHQSHSGEFVSRLTNDMAAAEKSYMELLGPLLTSIVVAAGALVYMAVLEWRMALLVLTMSALSAWIIRRYSERAFALGRAVQERLAAFTTVLSDLLSGLLVIKAHNLERRMFGKYTSSVKNVLDAAVKKVETQASFIAVANFMSYFTLVGTLAVASFLTSRRIVSVGTAMACVDLRNPIVELFSNGGQTLMALGASLAAVDRLASILDIPREPERINRPARVASDCATHAELGHASQTGTQYQTAVASGSYIACHDVYFRYSDDGPDVLNGLSLTIERGSHVAFVGPSGSGKTTLFRLLMGFYAPQRGAIAIDGRPIEEWTLEKLRAQITFVPQEPYLFPGTVRENIAYGKPGATIEEVVAAAKAANVHDVILEFEQGYDTSVGQRGAQMSGGQRQLIAIARAILKDTPILLLDEPSSSLDAASEALVRDALRRLAVNRTVLVIAHRLSTVTEADWIFVIEGGRVVEQGKHADLVKAPGGRYRKLYMDWMGTPSGC